jgi:hypothetical protein
LTEPSEIENPEPFEVERMQNDLEKGLGDRANLINIEEIKQNEGGPTKFCEICYEDHPESEFVTYEACGHAFCIGSYKSFFEYQIKESGKGYILKCP